MRREIEVSKLDCLEKEVNKREETQRTSKKNKEKPGEGVENGIGWEEMRRELNEEQERRR